MTVEVQSHPLSAQPALDTVAQRIQVTWLVRLRWGEILAQLFTIVLVPWALRISLPRSGLFALLTIESLSNAALWHWARRAKSLRPRVLCLPLAFDVVLLTMLLMLTGGHFNPFSFLYLVHITLAAVLLPTALAWCIVGLALGCFGLLFVDLAWLPPPPALNHPAHLAAHLRMHEQGMWCAFAVAAGLISHFVSHVRRSLAVREAELARVRVRALQNEKLALLARLATTAAHELSAPLSTIAGHARTLLGTLRGEEPLRDARLINGEVERCREILRLMAADTGQPCDPPQALGILQLLAAASAGLPGWAQVRVACDPAALEVTLAVPATATTQALRGVLKNALQASAQAGRADVAVSASIERGRCSIVVRDSGMGMSSVVLARAGEPFFTTKEPGEGMGLGLFLTRAVLERAGGELQLESQLGAGTTATLHLPLTAASASRAVPLGSAQSLRHRLRRWLALRIDSRG